MLEKIPQSVNAAYDVFNGDADGICALHQLRLVFPKDAELVTGVKRDVELLQRIPRGVCADVTALDISLDANVEALRAILADGGQVAYFDHHAATQAFEHPNLYLVSDETPEVCTSLLVDRYLLGRHRKWAIVAAFGENMISMARAFAEVACIDRQGMHVLEELGRLLNYNAYGERVEDLFIPPDLLYCALHSFVDPFDFVDASPHYRLLADGCRGDADRMETLKPACETAGCAIYILPCTPWARRISGIFVNRLAARDGMRSYAVLTECSDGSFSANVRSGLPALLGANGLCERFPTGGGRKANARINCLPASELDRFARMFNDYFSVPGMTAHERMSLYGEEASR